MVKNTKQSKMISEKTIGEKEHRKAKWTRQSGKKKQSNTEHVRSKRGQKTGIKKGMAYALVKVEIILGRGRKQQERNDKIKIKTTTKISIDKRDRIAISKQRFSYKLNQGLVS